MKTKFFALLFVLMLVFSISLVQANDEEVLDEDLNEDVVDDDVVDDDVVDDDVVEVKDEDIPLAFKTSHGATVRLLQLEKVIQRNIMQGELILDRLVELMDEEEINVTDDELKELYSLLDSLKELKEEVSNYELLGTSEDVEQFVKFRLDAVSLSKEFRDSIRVIIHDNELDGLRASINQEIKNSSDFKSIKENIRNNIRAHNGEVAKNALEKRGLSFDEFQNTMNETNMQSMNIRREVLANFDELSVEERNNALEDLKEEAFRNKIQARDDAFAFGQQARLNSSQRMQKRVEAHKGNLPSVVEIKSRIRGGLN